MLNCVLQKGGMSIFVLTLALEDRNFLIKAMVRFGELFTLGKTCLHVRTTNLVIVLPVGKHEI
eukprot:1160797-Pelagomonas_calceolata.AAC.7